MAFGSVIFKPATIASAASTSAGAMFGGVAISQINAYIPSMSTAANLAVQGTIDGTTYVRLYHPPINSSTVACNPIVIPSGAVTGGAYVQIPVAGLQGIRFVATDVVNNGLAIQVVGV
jgi:uncharacterized protein YhdP